jgi:hypothetical protein
MAYLAEDAQGKKEIADMIQLLAYQLLGTDFENSNVQLSVPPALKAKGEYPLGYVNYLGSTLYPFGLREQEWIQHTSIFGRSGAGKTNTVFLLIKNLINSKKPFLIFDWKRNYRDLLTTSNAFVYTVGSNTNPFAFNPLIPPEGVDPDIWLKKLIEIIAHAYFLGEGVMYLFQEAIHATYKKYKIYTEPKEYPTFKDVMNWLEEQPVKGRKSLWMDSAQRAIKSICFGPMGTVVNNNKQSNLSALLDNNVILELDRLTNADKTLIIESMLLWIHHHRLGEEDRETFKHALILEEAHHILARTTGKETIIETVLREIRELGEAIILVDQHPSMISPIALGNTYTTICLNLKHKADINAMGSAMLLDNNERELLGILPIGHAVVKLQGRWPQPFQISIPHQQINKGIVTDQKLTEIMKEQNAEEILGITDESQLPEEIILSEREENFLLDIIKYPFAGVVERYKRLLLSRRKGNTIKEMLIKKKLIETIEIPTRTGKTVLLEPTHLGTRLLQERGHDIKNNNSPESLTHKYWKEKTKKHYQKQGYSVLIEEPINGYTDLILIKNGEKIAVEIETGKSEWKKNLEKNLNKGFKNIKIITTNDKIYQKILETIQQENLTNNIKIHRAQEIP